jgi:DNA-binding CsgD family transcriptional regulator
MSSPDRLRGDLARLAHGGGGVRDFSRGAAQILARLVPFDAVSVLTIDPATRLLTSAYVEHGLRGAQAARMAEIEYLEDDVNTFGALARSGHRAASLSETTGGELDRSVRHRELRAPNGFGDELRAVLVSDSSVWGGLTLGRGRDREPFAPAEVAYVASVSSQLANGLRRATLLTAPSAGTDRSAGFALLASDGAIDVADAPAEGWLAELADTGPDTPVPPVVTAVASRARSIADGREPDGASARARVRTPSGTWLTVRGSVLERGDDAQTAVTLEPASRDELAPLVADAYELTDRERAVAQLVALGLTTDAIADRLRVSPWTVQDHLKSIFQKVGVGSRGELVARIFFEPSGPRLSPAQ